MTRPTIRELWRGDPDALTALRVALGRPRVARPTLRAAVQAWQKRHGYPPNGTLNDAQLAELFDEADAAATPEESTTPPADDTTETGDLP